MNAREILEAMKSVIPTPQKWGKHARYDPRTGRRCIMGAWDVAVEPVGPDDIDRLQAYEALVATIPPTKTILGFRPVVSPARYNDGPHTTHRDILAWIVRAIERLSPSEPTPEPLDPPPPGVVA